MDDPYTGALVILAGARAATYLLLSFIAWRWSRKIFALAMLFLSTVSGNTLYLAVYGKNFSLITPYDAAIAQTLVAVLLFYDFARARRIRWLLRGKI